MSAARFWHHKAYSRHICKTRRVVCYGCSWSGYLSLCIKLPTGLWGIAPLSTTVIKCGFRRKDQPGLKCRVCNLHILRMEFMSYTDYIPT
jgi:hypothetical protein